MCCPAPGTLSSRSWQQARHVTVTSRDSSHANVNVNVNTYRSKQHFCISLKHAATSIPPRSCPCDLKLRPHWLKKRQFNITFAGCGLLFSVYSGKDHWIIVKFSHCSKVLWLRFDPESNKFHHNLTWFALTHSIDPEFAGSLSCGFCLVQCCFFLFDIC